MPLGLAFERFTFLSCHGLGVLLQEDEAGAGKGRPSVIPSPCILCLPGVGMCLFSVTDWLFFKKKTGSILELENYQDTPLTSITGVVAIK